MIHRSACSAFAHSGTVTDFTDGTGSDTGAWRGTSHGATATLYGVDFPGPQTGRFTQEDPIVIAGGLNVYGYAAGDPVSYSDPYGLCAANLVQAPAGDDPDEQEKVCPGGLTHGEYYAEEDGFGTAQTKYIQLGFVASDNDREYLVGCEDEEIIHEEAEGSFVGVWHMFATGSTHNWPRRRGTFKLDIQPWQWYVGYVTTAQFGRVEADGYVWCETGDAQFLSVPIPIEPRMQ